jgi:hypothetical protein
MKKNILTYIIYSLFVIGAFITLFIVYRDIDSSFSHIFVMGYILFIFFALVYFLIVILLNLRKLKWFEIRKRLYKFIAYFALLSVSAYMADYFFTSLDLDWYNIVFNSLSLAFAFVFVDLLFFKEKKR